MASDSVEPSPPSPVNDQRYVGAGDVVIDGEVGMGSTRVGSSADCLHLFAGEGSVGVSFTTRRASLRCHVGQILSARAEEQMVRPETGPIIAAMAYEQAVRNRTVDGLVDHPVNHALPSCHLYVPITSPRGGTRPLPTTVPWSAAVTGRDRSLSDASTATSVVHEAETAARVLHGRSLTPLNRALSLGHVRTSSQVRATGAGRLRGAAPTHFTDGV